MKSSIIIHCLGYLQELWKAPFGDAKERRQCGAPSGSMAYMSPGLFPDVDATRLRHEMQKNRGGHHIVAHFSRMVLPIV